MSRKPPLLRDLIVVLANPPLRLSLDEIRKLTPYQIRLLYLRERDEFGRVVLPEEPVQHFDPYVVWCENNKIPLWYRRLFKQRYIDWCNRRLGVTPP